MCSSVCGLTSTGTSAPVGPGVPLEVLFPEQFPLLASRMADMQRQLAMLTGAATRTVEWTRTHRGQVLGRLTRTFGRLTVSLSLLPWKRRAS